jgi:itaconate CoA-transferase
MAAPARPLDGVTVIALEHAVAAPFCTRQLADHGARVIKIERPGTGDLARGYDRTVHGLSSYFVWLNRGKESVTLDLKDASAREALERLLARADVVVQNLAPGATERARVGDVLRGGPGRRCAGARRALRDQQRPGGPSPRAVDRVHPALP